MTTKGVFGQPIFEKDFKKVGKTESETESDSYMSAG